MSMYDFSYLSLNIAKHEPFENPTPTTTSKVDMTLGQSWVQKLRQFTEKHVEKCTLILHNVRRYPHPAVEPLHQVEKNFVTNSSYKGSYTAFGFNGKGIYTFPSGTIYKGEFLDDLFDGRGTMIFPCGTIVRGKWIEGVLIKPMIYFKGLAYDQDWQYCKPPDRRFEIEFMESIQPAGNSYITNSQPPKVIPVGYYDSGDGFYDPKTKCVCRYDDLTCIVRQCGHAEAAWIELHCRKAPEECVGPHVVTDFQQLKPFLDDSQCDSYYLNLNEIDLGMKGLRLNRGSSRAPSLRPSTHVDSMRSLFTT